MPTKGRPGEQGDSQVQQGSSKDLEEPLGSPAPNAAAPPHKAKRKRITPEQQEVLNKLFEKTDTPNLYLREELSKQIGMTPREIQVYYQNQRAKRRRLARTASPQSSAASNLSSLLATPLGEAPDVLPRAATLSPLDAPQIPSTTTTLSRPVLPPPYPSPSLWPNRRYSVEEAPIQPLPTAASSTATAIKLPPLREVFPDLLPTPVYASRSLQHGEETASLPQTTGPSSTTGSPSQLSAFSEYPTGPTPSPPPAQEK